MARKPYFDGDGPSSGAFAVPRATPVVRWLLWSNAILALAGLVAGPFDGTLPWASRSLAHKVYDTLSLEPTLWIRWAPFEPVWQLVTYGFLHSERDPFHVLYNMLGLYMFGPWLEGVIGARRFTVAYLLAIAVGGIVQVALSLAFGTAIPMAGAPEERWIVGGVGASGAILFLIVATAVLRPNMPVIFFIFPMRMRTLALIFVGLDVFRVVSALKGYGSDTAYAVHLAGAAFGFVSAKFEWLWIDPIEVWERRREVQRVEREHSDAERLDLLLARIHERGIGSLSRSERAFLKRMSSRREP